MSDDPVTLRRKKLAGLWPPCQQHVRRVMTRKLLITYRLLLFNPIGSHHERRVTAAWGPNQKGRT
jgi:hypothetical protein